MRSLAGVGLALLNCVDQVFEFYLCSICELLIMRPSVRLRFLLSLFVLPLLHSPIFSADAANHRVFGSGQQPEDVRLQKPKHLNGYFPFEVPASKAEWEQRQKVLKQRVLVATGLWLA